MKTVIHVHQATARTNRKKCENNPAIIVRDYKRVQRGRRVVIRDQAGKVVVEFVSRPDKPLSCGATIWAETGLVVEVVE